MMHLHHSTDLNANTTCRTCLAQNKDMLDLRGEDQQNFCSLLTDIVGLNLKFESNDAPYNVCSSCRGKMDFLRDFVSDCKLNHGIMLRHLRSKVRKGPSMKNELRHIKGKVNVSETEEKQFSDCNYGILKEALIRVGKHNDPKCKQTSVNICAGIRVDPKNKQSPIDAQEKVKGARFCIVNKDKLLPLDNQDARLQENPIVSTEHFPAKQFVGTEEILLVEQSGLDKKHTVLNNGENLQNQSYLIKAEDNIDESVSDANDISRDENSTDNDDYSADNEENSMNNESSILFTHEANYLNKNNNGSAFNIKESSDRKQSRNIEVKNSEGKFVVIIEENTARIEVNCVKNEDCVESQKSEDHKENIEDIWVGNEEIVDFGDTEEHEQCSEDDLEGNEDDCNSLDGTVAAERSPRKKIKRARAVKFHSEEVMEAIEALREKQNADIRCIKCGLVTSRYRSMLMHMKRLHRDCLGRWCSRCNAEFDDLEKHCKTTHRVDLMCRFCGKVFRDRGRLVEHLYCHALRSHKCELCNTVFKSRRALQLHAHKKKKKDTRRTRCIDCNQAYTGDDHICNSTDKMSTLKRNFCSICNRKVRSLKEHNGQEHSGIKSYKTDAALCSQCGKQFKSQSKLSIHMRIHTGVTPYKCKYCEYGASTKSHLVVHERTHTGEKPNVCHVCGRGFTQLSMLKTHILLHTGRPMPCMLCDKRFCRPSELKLHMRTHSGEKPYKCKECGRAFIQTSHLVEHQRTHTDERPHKCEFCGRGFKHSYSLKTHLNIHLGEKPYKCSQCPYACRQSYSLTQHMKQHLSEK